MDDLLREFLTETAESLAVLNAELCRASKAIRPTTRPRQHLPPGAYDQGNLWLRPPRLEQIAHAGENVLGRFRDGSLRVTPRR